MKNITRKFTLVALLALTASFAPAQNADSHKHSFKIKLDPAQTDIHWKVSGVLHTVHGVFQLKNGELLVNPETGLAEGEILVDATTEPSGTVRDKQMVEQVLESNRYPGIFFHPTQFKGGFPSGQGGNALADGTFNIHGADHPLQVALKIKIDSGAITATAQFSVPYVAWGMKNPSTFFRRVGKQVDVQVIAKGSIEQAE